MCSMTWYHMGFHFLTLTAVFEGISKICSQTYWMGRVYVLTKGLSFKP